MFWLQALLALYVHGHGTSVCYMATDVTRHVIVACPLHWPTLKTSI